MKKQNALITVILFSFFVAGLITESMEVVASISCMIILIIFGIGIKNEIIKLRKEIADKKQLKGQ